MNNKCISTGKRKIRNKKEAEELLLTLKIKRSLKGDYRHMEKRAYKCPKCHFLHLTSREVGYEHKK
jgi:hypothetical protein